MTEGEGHPSILARHRRTVELAAVIVLAATTILTAWAAFQATKWGGEQAISGAEANAARTESVRYSNLGLAQKLADVTTFTSWADAYATENTMLADFYFHRFRDEFKPAVEAWLATEPLVNEDAPATPFMMPEYQLEADARSLELQTKADQAAQNALDANERGDRYVGLTVIFAAVLFFAGVSTKMEAEVPHTILVSCALVGFVSGIAILLTFPIEL